MTEPLRLPCHTDDGIPSTVEIQKLVTEEQHLVLQFPLARDGTQAGIDKRRIIERLTASLPDYKVFDSGARKGEGTSITVMKVISAQDVMVNAEMIVAAARQFRTTARDLMTRLAEKLELSLEEVSDPYLRFRLQQHFPESLDAGWSYHFHGLECQFANVQTGQEVEVQLGFPTEFGVLDPWFFFRFVSTTSGLEVVAKMLRRGFHDVSRAFQVLERSGHLKRVADQEGLRNGLIAPQE